MGQLLHHQASEFCFAVLEILPDFGPERPIRAFSLWRAILDGSLGERVVGDAGVFEVSPAFPDSMLVAAASQGVFGLLLQGFLDNEAGCGIDEIRAAVCGTTPPFVD